MNAPASTPRASRARWLAIPGALALLLGVGQARATVTLEVYFNNGNLPAGALAALVADVAGDGFLDLADPTVSGTPLVVGGSIGGGDDRILALVSAAAGSEWVNGTGIAETVAGLDYAALGIAEGTALALYVFPDLRVGDDFFILGDRYVVYRSSVAGGSGGDIPFEAPSDGGVYTLAAITPVDGGDFEPSGPKPEETYETGHAGVGGDGIPDDHGNSRHTATPITDGTVIGSIHPGDLDFFEFTLDGLSLLSARTLGEALTEGWLFDADGNVLAAPGGGGFALQRILAAGTYWIALRGSGNEQTGTYSLNLSTRTLPQRRPDLTLGRSVSRQIGKDLYSPSGAGQIHRVHSRKGRRARAVFSVWNDGGLDSAIALHATRGNRFVRVRYRRITGGTLNVTGLAVSRGFLADYAPLTARFFRVDLVPTRRGKTAGRGRDFRLDATDGPLRDRGVVSLKVGRGR